jgi:fructokinase
MDLVCFGEILVDMFPSEMGKPIAGVEAFYPKPGGAPANASVAATRLGGKVAFLGKVGEDAFGHLLMDTLDKEGVNIDGLRFDPQVRTTLAFIAMPDEYSAEFVFYRNPGADLYIRPDELDRDLIAGAKAFHCGSLSLVEEPARSATHTALDLARQAGALVSFDVNYRPSLWKDPQEALQRSMQVIDKVHLLKVNENEMELLTGTTDIEQAGKQLLAKGPELIVITLGAKGSYFYTAHAQGLVPAFQVKTVDSIGCGDAFIAGLLISLVRSGDWRQQLAREQLSRVFRYASAVGAMTATKHGVIPALPYADQVDAFLKNHPEK